MPISCILLGFNMITVLQTGPKSGYPVMPWCMLCMEYCTVPISCDECFIWKITKRQCSGLSLLKDTTQKGNLSNKDRIILQQILWIPLILPLTEGHLSNEDRIIWRKGYPIRGGLLYMYIVLIHQLLQQPLAHSNYRHITKRNHRCYHDY